MHVKYWFSVREIIKMSSAFAKHSTYRWALSACTVQLLSPLGLTTGKPDYCVAAEMILQTMCSPLNCLLTLQLKE